MCKGTNGNATKGNLQELHVTASPSLSFANSGIKTTVNGATANGVATDTLEAFLVDTNGNPWSVPTTVSFTRTAGGATLQASCDTSASTGKCTVTATDTAIENNTATANWGGFALGGGGAAAAAGYGSSANFNFVAIVVAPALSITKSHSAASPMTVGQATNYTVTVSNSSATASTKATVSEALPAGVNLTSISGTGWSCAPASGTGPLTTNCTGPAISANASSSFTVNVMPTAASAGAVNNVSVDSTGGTSPPTPGSGCAPTISCASVSDVVNPAPNADVNIVKTQRLGTSGVFAASDIRALSGGVVQYQLVLGNNGPQAANGATFSDALSSNLTGVTVVSATPGAGAACSAAAAGNTVSGTVTTMPMGGTCTVIIQATANALTEMNTGLTNTATVAVPSGLTDPTPANNTSSVRTFIDGTVTIKKVVVGTPPAGDNGLFNLTFPSAPAFGPALTGATNQGNGGSTITQRIYPNAGGSNRIYFNETATAGSNLANYTTSTSCSTGMSGSPPSSNAFFWVGEGSTGGSANVVCTITNTAKTTDLAIVKSQSTGGASGPFVTSSIKVPVLGSIWFQLVVSNAAGQSTASNVTYSDAVPSNFINPSVVSTGAAGGATCPAPTFNVNALSGSGTTLPAGGSCTIVIQATPNTVTDPSAGVVNTATVITNPTGGNDTNTANNTSSVTTFINPVMQLNKTVVGTPPAGDSGLFNLAITGANASLSPSGGGANPSNNQASGGTTGWVMVDPTWAGVAWSDVTVLETAGTSTNSANYSAFLRCVDGTGAAWPSGAFASHNAAPAVGSTSNVVVVPQNGFVGTAAQIICTYTNTVKPKVLIVKTVISGAGSNLFNFALSGLSTGTDSITVVGNATANGSSTLIGTAGAAVTIGESSPAGWPANPVSASCVDSQTALSGNPSGPLGTLTGNVLSIPAANMVNGAAFTCTFTNHYGFSVSGRVFNDNGSGSGTANDGVINGAEAGIAGVSVTLTNCAGTTYATTTTNGSGNYSLSVPFGIATGAPLCLQETNLGSRISTGASVGIRALPSGVAVPGTGTNYTYTRTPDSIAFTFNGGRHSGLNFGDVGLNTFAAGGAKTGQPGNGVTYAHTFTTQTGGSVSFGIASSVAAPALTGWSEKIYADPLCTGAMQAGAAILFPPAVPTVVVAGQQVCVVMQEFIPATALNGYSNTATLQADFTFTNAAPALQASYQVTDITKVGSSALDLMKEVRNVTQAVTAFGINNQAKSGETLEYRLTYTNNGSSPVTHLAISDATPAYTSFVSGVDGTTPASLSACQKRTPANVLPAAAVACSAAQAVGGTGTINFQFTGPLNPGGTGNVLFQVKVD